MRASIYIYIHNTTQHYEDKEYQHNAQCFKEGNDDNDTLLIDPHRGVKWL